MSETMAIWTPEDSERTTQPPEEPRHATDGLSRLVRAAAGKSRLAASALDGHADAMSDWAGARFIARSLVQRDRDRAAEPVGACGAAVQAARVEAERVGLVEEFVGCLAVEDVSREADLVLGGVDDASLRRRADHFRDMATALDSFADDLEEGFVQ